MARPPSHAVRLRRGPAEARVVNVLCGPHRGAGGWRPTGRARAVAVRRRRVTPWWEWQMAGWWWFWSSYTDWAETNASAIPGEAALMAQQLGSSRSAVYSASGGRAPPSPATSSSRNYGPSAYRRHTVLRTGYIESALRHFI